MHKKAALISLLSILAIIILSIFVQKVPLGNIEKISNFVNFINIVVSGILALVGLLSIFLALSLEHKFQKAVESLLEYFSPYALSGERLRNLLNKYAYYIMPDPLVKSIYHIYIATTFGAIISWGLLILIHLAQYDFSLVLSLSDFICFTALFSYAIFTYILIYFANILKKIISFELINHPKFINNYFPKTSDLVDLDFLYKNEARIVDIIERSNIYINTYNIESKTLVVVKMPIGFINFCFNLKIIDNNTEKILHQAVGKFSSDEKPGDTESLEVSRTNSNLFEYLYHNQVDCKIHIEVYNLTGEKIFAKFIFSPSDSEYFRITFKLERVVRIIEADPSIKQLFSKITNNQLITLVENSNPVFCICQIENSKETPGKIAQCNN